VRENVLTLEEAAHHRMRNVITNAVGGAALGLRPEVHRHELLPDDALLLCTDGLTDMLADEQIANVLREEPTAEAGCRRLVAQANERGGHDNITIVLARFLSAA